MTEIEALEKSLRELITERNEITQRFGPRFRNNDPRANNEKRDSFPDRREGHGCNDRREGFGVNERREGISGDRRESFRQNDRREAPNSRSNPNLEPLGVTKKEPQEGGETTDVMSSSLLKRPRFSEELVIEKRPRLEVDESTKKRSSRMFGSLVGHLQRAKQVLTTELSTEQIQKRSETDQMIEQKLERVSRNLAEARKKDFIEQKEKDRQRMKDLRLEIAVKDTVLLRTKLEEHYKKMKSFIRTRAEPSLFWFPAEHNKTTRELQKETASQIEAKLVLLREELDEDTIRRQYKEREVAMMMQFAAEKQRGEEEAPPLEVKPAEAMPVEAIG